MAFRINREHLWRLLVLVCKYLGVAIINRAPESYRISIDDRAKELGVKVASLNDMGQSWTDALTFDEYGVIEFYKKDSGEGKAERGYNRHPFWMDMPSKQVMFDRMHVIISTCEFINAQFKNT